MGREWYWSRSMRSSGSISRWDQEEEEHVRERPPAGCMSGMLHLLQFRQLLLFPITSHHRLHGHHRHQRRPRLDHHHHHLEAMTKDRSLFKGFRGVHAKSTPPIDLYDHDQLGRGSSHHKFATYSLHAGAKQDGSDSARTASPEMKKEKTWVEDVVGSFQLWETPRTSNVVARLMGLDELPARPDATPRRFQYPSPAQVITLHQPSSPKPRQHHDHQKENNNDKQQQRRRRGKGRCGGEEDHSLPLAPLPGRRPLSAKTYNLIFEMEGPRSLPGTPRMSCSGRRSCDSETPRLSLQLDTPVMEEFDFLCEVVPERRHPLPASRKPPYASDPSPSSSTARSANNKPARLPQLRDDKRRTRAAAASSAQQHVHKGLTPGAGIKTPGGGTCSSTGHDNKKSRRSPPELNGENTPETKRAVREAVAVPKVDVAVVLEQHPSPVALSSSPSLDNGVAEGKKISRTSAPKPSTERFTEKLRRPPPEKAAGRSRTSASRSLTGQSKIQLPSPKPVPWPSPPPRRSPAVRPPAVLRPPEELSKEKLMSRQISPLTLTNRGRSSSRHHGRPDEDDEVYCSHVEFRYVRMILECAGLLNCKTRSGGRPAALIARCHSPSHPIDPIVFYRLELFLPDEEDELRQLCRLRHRCNRKLLFHLVEEILADIFRRHSLVANPRWRSRYHVVGDMTAAVVMEKRDGGDALLRQLWSCIRRIPPAGRFRDIRDIDVLLVGMGSMDGDALGRLNPQHRAMVGEEVHSIASVIEEGILDSLVNELNACC